MSTNPLQQLPEEQSDEIDLMEIIRYLIRNGILIISLAAIPVLLFYLSATFRKKSFNDQKVIAVLQVNTKEAVSAGSIITESIIQTALEQNNLTQIQASKILPLLQASTGIPELDIPLQELQAKLTGDGTIGRNERVDEIRQRYENLLANQKNFLTITFDFKKSPVDFQTAKILISEIIRIYNEMKQAELKDSTPLLSEIEMDKLEQLQQLNAFSLNQVLSLTRTFSSKTKALIDQQFNARGFNPTMLQSEIKYLELQVTDIIASNPKFRTILQRDISQKVNVLNDQIRALDEALTAISKSNDSAGWMANSQGGKDQGSISAEYNSELFDRFLNVGASLSLVDMQEKFLKQKLSLEFRKTNLQEIISSFTENSLPTSESADLYRAIYPRLVGMATTINTFIKDFNTNYQKETLELIIQKREGNEKGFSLKIFLLVIIASLGLAVIAVLLRRAFENKA